MVDCWRANACAHLGHWSCVRARSPLHSGGTIHQTKRLVAGPNSFLVDAKCPGCVVAINRPANLPLITAHSQPHVHRAKGRGERRAPALGALVEDAGRGAGLLQRDAVHHHLEPATRAHDGPLHLQAKMAGRA